MIELASPANLVEMASACQLGRNGINCIPRHQMEMAQLCLPTRMEWNGNGNRQPAIHMEMAQPANLMEMASACLGNWLSLPRPPPPSLLPAFHHHLKGSDYTLCTVLQYNKHYLIRLHWWNCSAVQNSHLQTFCQRVERENRSPARRHHFPFIS